MRPAKLGFCLAKHTSGVLCVRLSGHRDHRDRGDLEAEEHCSWDFTRTVGDPPRPGAVVVWVDEQASVESPVRRVNGARVEARAKGYTGDACGSCGALSMKRNGSCLVCVSCGETTGCS